jgi:predicted nucleic-acid-binding Zn-ribbon protein
MNKIKFFFSLVLIILTSCNQPEDKIKKECPDCKIEELKGTEILMATNSSGLSNFYDKTSNSFMLTSWVNAAYARGIIFDDITFVIEGRKIYLIKSDFPKISDAFLRQKLSEEQEADANTTNSGSGTRYCAKHSQAYASGNTCSKCVEDSFMEEANKPGGLRDRVMRP